MPAVNGMKKSSKITLCAICSALSFVIAMLGHIPVINYSAAAIAGLFVMIPLVEISIPYAFATYITSAVLIGLFGEIETKILFILLFGFYPVLKAIIEKIANNIIEWALKLATFTASIILAYLVMKYIFGIDVDNFGPLGKYGVAVFLILSYVAFVLYDLAISRISMFYFIRIRPHLSGIKK